jgi:hypothetical protein
MVSYKEEEGALTIMVQEVFDLLPFKHSKKPMLVKCKTEFVMRWGAITTEGLILTEDNEGRLV